MNSSLLFQVDLKPSLLPNAAPRIFKGVPDYLSKPTAETRPSPSKRRKMVHEQDDWLESDLIGTYDHMTSSIADLVSFIMNPIHITQKIFLMFDTVHLLKCVRNNWINDIDQTFTYPDFDNCSFIRSACFKDLITIYYMEKDSVLKDGYLLTLKSLFQNSIERQNVKLVLKEQTRPVLL